MNLNSQQKFTAARAFLSLGIAFLVGVLASIVTQTDTSVSLWLGLFISMAGASYFAWARTPKFALVQTARRRR